MITWDKVKVVRKKKRKLDPLAVHSYTKEQWKGGREFVWKLQNMEFNTSDNYKAEGTSQGAAKSMVSKAATLRTKVYTELKKKPNTADNIAQLLNETPFSIRPRFSELKAKGLIEETGKLAKNESERFANVWRVK